MIRLPVGAVLNLERAHAMADLADDLRAGRAHLSVAHVVRRELSSLVSNPDLEPQRLDVAGTPNDPDAFPGRALGRIISVMQTHRLVQDTAADEVVAGFETVMTGALQLALTDPGRKGVLLDAAEHLISASYDRAGAGPAEIAAALPEVVEILEDTVDELVGSAAPDRPTTAVLWPRERPGPLTPERQAADR